LFCADRKHCWVASSASWRSRRSTLQSAKTIRPCSAKCRPTPTSRPTAFGPREGAGTGRSSRPAPARGRDPPGRSAAAAPASSVVPATVASLLMVRGRGRGGRRRAARRGRDGCRRCHRAVVVVPALVVVTRALVVVCTGLLELDLEADRGVG